MRKGDDLTTFMCRVSSNMGLLNRRDASGPHRPVIGTALPFYLDYNYKNTDLCIHRKHYFALAPHSYGN